MIINIITPDDLEAFKKSLLEDLVKIVEQKTSASNKWLKADDVLRTLKISPNTLHRLREQGTLPYTKIGGTYYYDFDDIKKVLDENKIHKRGGLLPGEEPERKRRKDH
jgi:hypothetical protein